MDMRPAFRFTVLAWSALAVCASAQEPSPSPTPAPDPPRMRDAIEVEGEMPPIPPAGVTTFKLPVPVQLTPASVAVVPRAVFEGQDAFFLGDALRNVSGVSVATGFGVFDFFTIRGFDSLSSSLVLTDGAFEPESTFYPLYNVRQVEVVKGPAAFLYGANPLSGAVHLVRKQPVTGRAGTASVSYGSFGTVEVAGDGNLSSADGSLAARVNGVFRDSAAYRDGRDSQLCAVNPVVAWRPDDATRVVVNLEAVRSRMNPDVGLPIVGDRVADVPRTRSYQTPLDRSDQDIYRARLDAERVVGPSARVRAKVYYTDFDWQSEGTLLAGVFAIPRSGELIVARSLLLLDDRQTALGTQLEASWSGRAGVAHEALFGVEVARLGDRFTLDIGLPPTISLLDPVETAAAPVDILPGASADGDARSIVIAPYLVDRIRLGDRLQAVLGARFDVLDFEEPRMGSDRHEHQLSPMAGLTFTPRPGLTAYLQAGSAFGPPSSLVVGERRPERSRQLEAGLKSQLRGGRAFATVAAYHLERNDIAIPDATGVTRQNGDQRARGIELELSGEPAPTWFTTASYAFTSARLTRFAEVVPNPLTQEFSVLDFSGNVPAFAPRHLFNVWTVKRAGALSVGGGARFVGRQFIAEDNGFAIDSYVVLDAMASYKLKRTTLSVNVKNLGGAEYETRGFGRTAVIPADPFAVYGTVSVNLGR